MNSPRPCQPFPPAWGLRDLRLAHLADSALPIGSLAHSFGIESLAAEEVLKANDLAGFFLGYLEEAGMVDAVACREGWRVASGGATNFPTARWRRVNEFLSALKPAREARAASASLGENFLRGVLSLGDFPVLRTAVGVNGQQNHEPPEIHHSPAFGLACGALGIGQDSAALAYLHQSIASLVSACQRLMPLGQTEAMRLIWDLKPTMMQTAEHSRDGVMEDVFSFMPLLDWGSMEHPALGTRLFIS